MFVKIFVKFRFFQKFHKISILVKFSKILFFEKFLKISILVKFLKNFDFCDNFLKI